MNLEQICTSLEMSKKLQEAGFKGDTCFWWVVLRDHEDKPLACVSYSKMPQIDFFISEEAIIPAYTFEQIWKELKKYEISTHNHRLTLDITLSIGRRNEEGWLDTDFMLDGGLANAAAQAWLWCEEKGYIN